MDGSMQKQEGDMSDTELSGQSALVTGAPREITQASAASSSKLEAQVQVVGGDQARGEPAVAGIGINGQTAVIQSNLRDATLATDGARRARMEVVMPGEEQVERPVFVLGLGGSLRRPSESEVALRMALRGAAEAGADTQIITADSLDLPLYLSPRMDEHPVVVALLRAVRRADGLILASPAYHGTMSGAVKNALDYFQFLTADDPPYLDGCAVGVLSTGAGTQATVQTCNALRDVAHALRAWPTPIGVPIPGSRPVMAETGEIEENTAAMLRAMGAQVVQFALAQRAWRRLQREQGDSRRQG
jgi:FMN reductase